MGYLFGQNGKLILVGGKPLSSSAAVAPTTGVTLKAWSIVQNSTQTGRFILQTSAASNDLSANVPIIFTYTGGAPAKVEARIVDSLNSNAEVVTWTDISASVFVKNGNSLGYLNNVPAGIGYKRQIRVNNSSTLINLDTVPFNIGWMVSPWGQSNMQGTLSASSNGVPGTGQSEAAFYLANGTAGQFGKSGFVAALNSNVIGTYSTVSNGGYRLMRMVGDRLQAKFGRKVGIGMNPWAQNGTAMTGFMSSSLPAVSSMLAQNGDTTGGTMGFSSPEYIIANGDYRIVAWHQGESEQGATTNRTPRRDDLIKFCQMHIDQVAKFGRPASKLTFLFALMGVTGPTASHQENLRGAVLDLIDYVQQNNLGWDVRMGWNCIDLGSDLSNGVYGLHFTGDMQVRSILRLIQAMNHVVDPVGVPYGAEGPRIVGTKVTVGGVPVVTGVTSRSGDDVTITVTHEGPGRLLKTYGTGAISGWYANTAPDFTGTEISLSNVTIVDSTHVRVTATGAPATFYIKYCGHKALSALSYSPDVSNPIFDDFTYPTGAASGDQLTGLPLWPTPDSLKVGP